MFGFCGSNGSGKTTTMRIAMGLLRADAGDVRWQGRPLDQEPRRRIGYMPEERGLYPKMKVADQVTYFARLHGLDAAAAARASRRVAGPARPGRAPRRPGGEAVAGQPAARPAGRRAGQPARGAHPRRAVLRPRPGRRRLPRRGAARAGARAACRSCSPATSSTSSSGCATPSASSPAVAWWPPARSRSSAAARPAGCSGSSSRTQPTAGPAALPGVRVVSEQAGDTLLDLAPRHRRPGGARGGPAHRPRHALRLAPAHPGRDVPRGRAAAPSDGRRRRDRDPATPGSAALVRLVAGREVSTRIRDKTFLFSSAAILLLVLGAMVFQIVVASGATKVTVGVVGRPQRARAGAQGPGQGLRRGRHRRRRRRRGRRPSAL